MILPTTSRGLRAVAGQMIWGETVLSAFRFSLIVQLQNMFVNFVRSIYMYIPTYCSKIVPCYRDLTLEIFSETTLEGLSINYWSLLLIETLAVVVVAGPAWLARASSVWVVDSWYANPNPKTTLAVEYP